MGYISPEREKEYKEKIFDDIYLFSWVYFMIALIISMVFMRFHFRDVSSFFELFYLLLKVMIFSVITTIFFTIMSLLFFSMNFHFRKKFIYYFYKIKYRNNMNDVNYTYLCKRLEILILNNKMSKKKIEKEASFLLKKNTLRNEEIERNLKILRKKEIK